MSVPSVGLARRMLGGPALWLFAVGASSPMTVLAGSVPATYASTGVIAVPVLFLLLGAALAVLSLGYVAAGRQMAHAAPFAAILTRGLGRVVGVAGAVEALVGYHAIQICLYGLIGATLAGDFGGPWWLWALTVWTGIAVLGVFTVRLNATVLGWLLGLELALIAVFDLGALTHPAAGHLTGVSLSPAGLAGSGIGGALALGAAAFVGFEQPPVFAEEARRPTSISRATFAALGFLAVFYAVSSWALAAAIGPDQVATAAGQDPNLAFTAMQGVFGPLWGVVVATLGRMLFVSSMFAAMLAFHNSVARHLFALGRDGVVPGWLGQAGAGTGRRSGAPVAGSLTQSFVALVVIVVFAAVHADPVATLFTWLATVAAVSVMTLLTVSCLAAVGIWLRQWRRRAVSADTAPVAAGLAGGLSGFAIGVVVLAVTVTHLDALLGVRPGSVGTLLVPGLVAAAALVGLVWGCWLRLRHPGRYHGIGAGAPHPLAVLDQRLADVEV